MLGKTALQGIKTFAPKYDAILVDEAQDFSPNFLLLCYEYLKEPKRLVYAYDELQISNNTPAPLTQPVFTLDNSLTTQLAVYLTAVSNAKAYQLQVSTNPNAWQESGIYPNTKGIVLSNLTPGTLPENPSQIYTLQLRATPKGAAIVPGV